MGNSIFSFGFARVTEVRHIYFPYMFTEIGWMLENVNFSIALRTNFNVRNFEKSQMSESFDVPAG